MAGLDDLRREVMARHKAANAKVSRLRGKGVELAGTEYDIRRNTANVKRYNRKQLEAYRAELNGFVNRRNAFVAGSGGAPLPKARVRLHEQLLNQYNARAESEYSKVSGLELPNLGQTIEGRDAMVQPNPKRRQAAGMPVNRIFSKTVREANDITSASSLEVFIRDLQKKTAGNYKPTQLAKQRKQYRAMLKDMGADDLLKDSYKLTNDQFNVLWNYTNFASEISQDYEIAKLRGLGKIEEAHERIVENDSAAELRDLLQWVETTIPKKKNGRNRK